MFRLLRVQAAVAALCLVAAAAPASKPSDYTTAQAALADLKAAMAVITSAEDSFQADPAIFHGAAQKAINVLVGQTDPLFVAAAGAPQDPTGAIGRIDALLDRQETPAWAPALTTAEVNERAAVGRLQVARTAHELNDFQIAASQALGNLDVALGRADDANVFGAMEGALATTELGVPDDAHRVDACAPATAGWGLHEGRLGFVAVATGAPALNLPNPIGVTAVLTSGNVVVLQTAAWPAVTQACSAATPANPPAAKPATSVPPVATHAASPQPNAEPGALPALYTQAQAEAGEAVYAANCVSCHGPDLHGRAAPAIAGTDFLTAAKDNDWTLEQIQYIVTAMMPLNASGSLSPEQYADVIAYLLASNCFPAGTTAFPQDDQSKFADIKFSPPAHPTAGQNALGVCPLK